MNILDSLKVGPLPLYTTSRCRKEELGDEYGAINHLLLKQCEKHKDGVNPTELREEGHDSCSLSLPFLRCGPYQNEKTAGLQTVKSKNHLTVL